MASGSTASYCVERHADKSVMSGVERAHLKTVGAPRVVAQDEFERLQNQANRLEHLLQVMPAGVVVLDGKGIVKQANTLARELLGEPLEGQVWRNIISRSFDPRKDDGHEVSLHDGRKVKLSISPLVDEPGQLIVLTDLTETRQLQQRISHMQRLSSLGKTVASLVHQIRTPLSAAILYAANLGSANLKEADKQRFSGKLQSRLRDLETQVNDMLLFAKSGEKQVVHPFTLAELFLDVKVGADAMLKQQGAALIIEQDQAGASIMGNKPALAGALLNLVHNAIQVMPSNAVISLSSEFKNNTVNLVVSDNGPGIAQEQLSQLFEPFYTTKSQGTGLGLAVVRAVAKAHGGEVSVANNDLGGARFEIRLPLQANNTHINSAQRCDKQKVEG